MNSEREVIEGKKKQEDLEVGAVFFGGDYSMISK